MLERANNDSHYQNMINATITSNRILDQPTSRIITMHAEYFILGISIAVLKKVRYALCPMPYALCPMPYAQSYLIFLRKAIYAHLRLRTATGSSGCPHILSLGLELLWLGGTDFIFLRGRILESRDIV